jgi:HlyD family secretion protein
VLTAPLSAEIDKIVLQPGELATAGFPILTLVDVKDTWAVFNVREDDFRGIRLGAEMTGTVPALDNRAIRLVVDYISPRGDYATWRATRQSSGYDVRTFEVRARPRTPVEGLRPGMSVLIDSR